MTEGYSYTFADVLIWLNFFLIICTILGSIIRSEGNDKEIDKIRAAVAELEEKVRKNTEAIQDCVNSKV